MSSILAEIKKTGKSSISMHNAVKYNAAMQLQAAGRVKVIAINSIVIPQLVTGWVVVEA